MTSLSYQKDPALHRPPPLTVDQVAHLLRLRPKTIRDMIRRNDLAAFKVGQQWRVHYEDVPGMGGRS